MVGHGASIETVAEGNKSDSPAQKKKGKEKASTDAAKAVESEGPKFHQPEFFHRGQPMLVSASALRLASISYSMLSSSILPADEEELLGLFEVSLMNQAFHNLVKETLNRNSFTCWSPSHFFKKHSLIISVFCIYLAGILDVLCLGKQKA